MGICVEEVFFVFSKVPVIIVERVVDVFGEVAVIIDVGVSVLAVLDIGVVFAVGRVLMMFVGGVAEVLIMD